MIKYAISEKAIQKAVEQFGIEGMTRKDLSAFIKRKKKEMTYSASVAVAAAKRVRFKKRVMGWGF